MKNTAPIMILLLAAVCSCDEQSDLYRPVKFSPVRVRVDVSAEDLFAHVVQAVENAGFTVESNVVELQAIGPARNLDTQTRKGHGERWRNVRFGFEFLVLRGARPEIVRWRLRPFVSAERDGETRSFSVTDFDATDALFSELRSTVLKSIRELRNTSG